MLDLPAFRRRGDEGAAWLETGPSPAAPSVVRRPRPTIGLAARVLMVTLGFVLLAVGMFYVTRLAAFRDTWLRNKLAMAETAFEAFDGGGADEFPPDLSRRVLASVGVKAIVVSTPTRTRILSEDGPPVAPLRTVDLDSETFPESLRAAFRAMSAEPATIIEVSDSGSPASTRIAITLDETPLKQGLWRIARAFLNAALFIAAVIACVLWIALWHMVLRPVRRLTTNIIAFGERPKDLARMIVPSGGADEIGRAETALAAMQSTLVHELAQRERLAELGMAVARINHDLRNMLTAAQLISDRLAAIPDPLAQRLAPRLIATLDRAIQFCQVTLTYGAGREQPPDRRLFDLSELVGQIVESAHAEHNEAIDFHVDIPPRFEVFADPDHILRVLENLSRNAAQALLAKGAAGGRPRAIRFAAIRTNGDVIIEVGDTGPGFPADQGERIFEPFHATTSDAGAGLGLSIAADLVARNGGAIELAPAKAEDFYCGARFLITLPSGAGGARTRARELSGP
jgi:signal transduction histidine kinase